VLALQQQVGSIAVVELLLVPVLVDQGERAILSSVVALHELLGVPCFKLLCLGIVFQLSQFLHVQDSVVQLPAEDVEDLGVPDHVQVTQDDSVVEAARLKLGSVFVFDLKFSGLQQCT
jgi:hypothetical protein